MPYKLLLFLLLIGYAAVCLVVWIIQEKLIFFPRPISEQQAKNLIEETPGVQEIKVSASDGIELYGWLLNGAPGSPLIIYYGGNAEEVSWLIEDHSFPESWSVLLMNYRGYGRSQGKPTEKKLKEDALLIFDYIKNELQNNSASVVLMGRSMGTGIATWLASKRAVDGVILISPYDSIRKIAQSTFPVLPVRLLLKHPFNSLKYAEHLSMPLLCLMADNDQVVPYKNTQRLYDAWVGEKELVVLMGHDHNSLLADKVLWDNIQYWLAKLPNEHILR